MTDPPSTLPAPDADPTAWDDPREVPLCSRCGGPEASAVESRIVASVYDGEDSSQRKGACPFLMQHGGVRCACR